jgi:hypothetical protein
MFAVANIAGEHGLADKPQFETGIIADELTVVGRIARDESDREA